MLCNYGGNNQDLDTVTIRMTSSGTILVYLNLNPERGFTWEKTPNTERYLGPYQTPTTALVKIVDNSEPLNIFAKKLHSRCFLGF